MNIPIAVSDMLERRLGRGDALAVAQGIEATLAYMEKRIRGISFQRKLEAKDEPRRELRDELATKQGLAGLNADMSVVKENLAGLKKDVDGLKAGLASQETKLESKFGQLDAKIESRFGRMEKKFTILFGVTIFAVLFVNQNALKVLARVLGLIR